MIKKAMNSLFATPGDIRDFNAQFPLVITFLAVSGIMWEDNPPLAIVRLALWATAAAFLFSVMNLFCSKVRDWGTYLPVILSSPPFLLVSWSLWDQEFQFTGHFLAGMVCGALFAVVAWFAVRIFGYPRVPLLACQAYIFIVLAFSDELERFFINSLAWLVLFLAARVVDRGLFPIYGHHDTERRHRTWETEED